MLPSTSARGADPSSPSSVTRYTSFRVSISKLIGVSAPGILCTAERGRNITAYSTDSDEVKLEWMTQLLSSIITLLQGQNDPHLETLTTGGQADCTILTILRSLSNKQLEELRPDAKLHKDCTVDICHGKLLTFVGNFVNFDLSCFSESNIMNTTLLC